jgi:hypothetical protein
MSDSQVPTPPGAPVPPPDAYAPPPGGYAPPPGGYAPPPPPGYAPPPQGGYAPQPQQQPAPGYPPQPMQQQPAPGYPPQPMQQQPAKKSRKGLWIALGVIVFLMGCCLVSVVGLSVYSAGQDRAAYSRAETKLEAAFKDVEAATSSVDMGSDPTAIAGALQPKIAKAKQGVADARKEIESVGTSDKKTAYVKSLDEIDGALTKLDTVVTGLQDIGKLTTEMTAVGVLVKNADGAVGAGITAANAKRYDEAVSDASAATLQYAQAEAMLAKMEADWPGVGMAQAQQTVALKRSNADRLTQLAALGRSGSTSTYNKVIDEYNGVLAQLRTRPLPDFASNPDLLTADLQKSLADTVAQLTKAAADHDAAITALNN